MDNPGRSRIFTLLLLAAGLIFTGMASRQPLALALSLPLIVYLTAAVVFSPRRMVLTARRSLSVLDAQGDEQAVPPQDERRGEWIIPAGAAVRAHFDVENNGPALHEVHCADQHGRHSTCLPAQAGTHWFSSFQLQRGRYRLEDIMVEACDPMGLFTERVHVAAPTMGSTQGWLLALPATVPLGRSGSERIPLRPPRLSGFAGPVAARQPGSGTDFYGVREFRPGDDRRHVNWRLSGRGDEALFTNQYEGERFADVGLILDARRSRNLLSPQGGLFEYSVLAAASIGKALLRDGHRLSLLVYGFGMERLLPGTGRVHAERLLRTLATAETYHHYALESLKYLPTRLFPPRSQIIFFSPLSEDDFAPLTRFRAQGYEVLVIAPDPLAFEAGVLASQESPAGLSAALRLARVERSLLLRSLERFGIWVVNWQVDQPLYQALQLGLAPLRQPHRNI